MLIIKKDNKTLQYDDSYKAQFDKDNIQYCHVPDNSEIVHKMLTAHQYEFIFDNDEVKDIKIIKTHEQWQSEQPIPEIKPSELELLRLEVNELKAKISKSEADIAEIKEKPTK